MKRSELRDLIREELETLLQDDAVFSTRDLPGILPDIDVPGDQEAGRNLSYGHTKASDHEGRNTKKYLYQIAKKSQSLHDMLNDNDDLPEWLQSKVAQCADKMDSVYDYLEYKIHRDH